MQMMNQYRPVEELPDNQNGTDEGGPTENGVQDVEMPLLLVGNPNPILHGNVAQKDDASANDSKMEEWIS